jgi:putative membrane-bound dehydrogenase-like protein
MLVNPTCMDIDHMGRVWVVESVNYRCKLNNKPLRRPEGDRILILEDTRGTGKADKVTVFYQSPDILAPLGIAVLPHHDGPGCTVYVCQSPDILVFEDKDGDGKADGPPRKLLSGFKGIDHDHGVHGILIGPDGKLYFTVGDQGVQNLVDKFGRKWTSNNTDCRAGTTWRCDLDGRNLELIAHNFRNHYEPCVDSFGTVFVSDNDDDGNQQTRICYVMPGGNYGYHHNPKVSHWNEEMPGVVPKILRTYFGSPTGICVYEGTLLPKQYQGSLLHTDAGPRQVRSYGLKPNGAGYTVDREDIVNSSDTWFRPSDVCVAPDGSVFIADWYDPGVGGHGMGDIKQGRIYRLAPTGNKPAKMPVDLQSKEGLLVALASPNLATRAAAITKLQSNGLAKALEVLTPAVTQKENVYLRARGLWLMGKLGHLRFINAAFEDPDPRFRILSMRILADMKDYYPVDYIPHWKELLVKDPSAAVRREALLLSRRSDPVKAADLILDLANTYDGRDRFFLCAIGIAVGQDPARQEKILADFEKHFPDLDEKSAGILWELKRPFRLPALLTKLKEDKLSDRQRGQIMELIAGSPEPEALPFLLKSLADEKSAEIREQMLIAFKNQPPARLADLAKTPTTAESIGRLFQQPSTREAALVLVELMGLKNHEKQVIALAQDPAEPLPLRIQAIRTLRLFKSGDGFAALISLAGKEGELDALREQAFMTLGRQGTEASESALQLAVTGRPSLPLKRAAVAALAGNKSGAEWLLQEHAKKTLSADLTPDLARLLRNSPFKEVKKQAQSQLPAPPKLDPKNLPSIPALLARKGNADRGRTLMQATFKNDAACMKCHAVNNEGGKVGPDLSVIGSKASRENLLESILYPSRAISDQFVTWQVETKGGLNITGVIAEETPDYLVLRDANVKEYKVAVKDIETRSKSPLSLMPDNLILHLPEDDLLDIVEYLYSLRSPVLGQPTVPVSGKKK